MLVLSHLHQLFNAEQCQAYIRTLRWKDRPLQCPRCQSHPLAAGARTTIDPAANAPGAILVSAPSTTLPIPCCIGARDHCHTGFSPPFCCVSPARPGASPESWASSAGLAIGGAGGCAMRPCPMRCSASWTGQSRRMTSITRLARRGKPGEVAASPWVVDRVVAARSASRAEAIMTKTGRPSSRGSVAKEQSCYTRPAISRCTRCRRPLTSRCKRAVASTPTRPAVIGRSRAMCTHSSGLSQGEPFGWDNG